MSNAQSVVPAITGELQVADAQKRRVAQELESYGYVTEFGSLGSIERVICRHPAAPDLLVHDDGRLELIKTELPARAAMSSPPASSEVRWGRLAMILLVAGGIAFLSLLVFAMIVG